MIWVPPGLPRWSGLVVLLGLFLLAACSATGQSPPQDDALLVSAASDLIPAFTAIGQEFQAATGIAPTFNFGSSGKLAQQIAEGAPVDVFASANRRYVQELADLGRILEDTRQVYARGRLVLWTRADSGLDIRTVADLDQPQVRRIALAHPDHAPYGVAAREALQAAGLWERLQSRLVFGENVRATLQLAETGNVDVALVALSLAMESDGRWVLVPQEMHRPIEQEIGVVQGTRHEEAARAFVAFVAGPQGQAILARYGFEPPGGAP